MLLSPILLPREGQWLSLNFLHSLSAQDSVWLQKELHRGVALLQRSLNEPKQSSPFLLQYRILTASPRVSAGPTNVDAPLIDTCSGESALTMLYV